MRNEKGRTTEQSNIERCNIFFEILNNSDAQFAKLKETEITRYFQDNLGQKDYYAGIEVECRLRLGLSARHIRTFGLETYLNFVLSPMTPVQIAFSKRVAASMVIAHPETKSTQIKAVIVDELEKVGFMDFRCLDRRLLTIAECARRSPR